MEAPPQEVVHERFRDLFVVKQLTHDCRVLPDRVEKLTLPLPPPAQQATGSLIENQRQRLSQTHYCGGEKLDGNGLGVVDLDQDEKDAALTGIGRAKEVRLEWRPAASFARGCLGTRTVIWAWSAVAVLAVAGERIADDYSRDTIASYWMVNF
jgi:hypothetical protein